MGASNYTDILLEDMNSKFDTILEIVTPLVSLPQEVRELREKVEDMDNTLRAGVAAIKDHSTQLRDHDYRITTLETTSL